MATMDIECNIENNIEGNIKGNIDNKEVDLLEIVYQVLDHVIEMDKETQSNAIAEYSKGVRTHEDIEFKFNEFIKPIYKLLRFVKNNLSLFYNELLDIIQSILDTFNKKHIMYTKFFTNQINKLYYLIIILIQDNATKQDTYLYLDFFVEQLEKLLQKYDSSILTTELEKYMKYLQFLYKPGGAYANHLLSKQTQYADSKQV